jgi:hypothetical protein
MPSLEVFCMLILFVTMTIAFAVGSLLVRLMFYSSVHGFDDISIDVMDDLEKTVLEDQGRNGNAPGNTRDEGHDRSRQCLSFRRPASGFKKQA